MLVCCVVNWDTMISVSETMDTGGQSAVTSRSVHNLLLKFDSPIATAPVIISTNLF